MTTLINGSEATSLPADDRGLLYGDGLFETIAVCDGMPQLWERHMQRLALGCGRLDIGMPDTELLLGETLQVAGNMPRAVVKIIVTSGRSARGYRRRSENPVTRIVQGRPWPDYPGNNARSGVVTCWCQTRLARQPRLAGMKHLNRLEQVLARNEWRDEYAEGLMCDTEGLAIEGTMTNLFVVSGGTLITPDLSQSGVAGVMRAEVLEQASRLGIDTRIQPVPVGMVEAANEIFLTNSLIGIWPVARLATRNYVVGEITKTLQTALSAG